MSRHVNLLLLLSALLSALTGVDATVRQPQQASAVVRQEARTGAVVAVPAARPERPISAPASSVALAAAPLVRALVHVVGEPLYFARRRE